VPAKEKRSVWGAKRGTEGDYTAAKEKKAYVTEQQSRKGGGEIDLPTKRPNKRVRGVTKNDITRRGGNAG